MSATIMDRIRNKNKKAFSAGIFVAVILLVMSMSSTVYGKEMDQNAAVNGVIDLSRWDAKKMGI